MTQADLAAGVTVTATVDDGETPAAADEFGDLLDELTERGTAWPNDS